MPDAMFPVRQRQPPPLLSHTLTAPPPSPLPHPKDHELDARGHARDAQPVVLHCAH